MFVSRWTVDYGDGPQPVAVPHAWGQDVSVEWEGPAVYRTEVDVPRGGGTLRFHGVSYAVEVRANGELVARHEGIWDAFDVPLPGGKVAVEVRVVKNGGPTYPVEATAGGGLPYVFQTFGGIYREVELLEEPRSLVLPPPDVRGPLPYLRAVVHRGWYPDLGHPSPDESLIRRELREIKALGFNTVKFAGWVPPQRYLALLETEGLLGWLQLPLGGMCFDPEALSALTDEVERIARQYRHHACLVLWSLGDAYLAQAPHDERATLVESLRALTGAWVADGTDGRVGDHNDFDDLGTLGDPDAADRELRLLHPGPREPRPAILGELGEAHAHRDLARLGDELPYWASALPELNAKGARVGSLLSERLETSRFALEPTRNGHRALLGSSRAKGAFVRKTVVETARSGAAWLRGYALAELRDTPVSSSGLFDDWGAPRLSHEEAAVWNGPACLFPMEMNRWSRAETPDPLNHFAGSVRLRLGLHAEPALEGRLWWRVVDEAGRTVARGAGPVRRVEGAHEVGTIEWPEAIPGEYRLEAGFGPAENAWDLWVVESAAWKDRAGWRYEHPTDDVPWLALPGGDLALAYHRPVEAKGGVLFLAPEDEGAGSEVFWNDCALEFRDDAFWSRVPFRERWSRLLPVSARATLRPDWLKATFGAYDTLIERVDTSPHAFLGDAPILVRAGRWIVTTLHTVPIEVHANPAARALLQTLMRVVES